MAAPVVYRVPRRFMTFPQDPPPYGSLAVSFVAHMLCFGTALALSAFLGSRIDQSKVYVVNLVPATPSLGSPAAEAPPPTARTPREAPRPSPPPPKAEEKAPPKAARPERPPERPPERIVEPPPPRVPEVATARPKSLEPSELALPRPAKKESPVPPVPSPRVVEQTLPPPPSVTPSAPAPVTPSAPPRLPEPPRIAAPPPVPTAPAAVSTLPPAPPAGAARSAVEPMRLGRPNAPTTSTGSIAVDASDFPFTYYLRLIQSKIGERWSPPRAAAAGGERVIVLFEIQRDGQVREPTVERSSGNALYDQSALRAVAEASPFPPLPPEFKASSLRVHFGFEFQPGQG
jgi:TonB family protein